jgi:hypothetical protein
MDYTEITTNKQKFYSTILRTLPTAIVRPSSRNVNRPSWGKRLNGSIQIAWPDWVNSNLAMATWSCLIKRGCSWVLSPVFDQLMLLIFLIELQ